MVRLPEASNKCPARKFSALPHGRADFYKVENGVFRLIKNCSAGSQCGEEEICYKQPAAGVESCKQDSN